MKKKQRIRNKWLTGSLLFLTLSASFPAQAARSPEVTETELLRSGEGDEAELEGPGLGENGEEKETEDGETDSFTEEELTDSLIEYGELEELLKRGNASLKSAVSQYDTNLEIYQEALEVLSSAKQEMKEYAEELENENGSPELIAQYQMNESQLGASVAQMNRTVRKLTGVSGTKFLKSSVNAMVKTAQTVMCSYNQMRDQRQLAEKQEESARASYEKAQTMAEAGMLTEQELLEAEQSLLTARISLQSAEKSEASMKVQLSLLIGRNPDDTEIGEIPPANVDFIDTVVLEEDKKLAVTSDSEIQALRRGSSSGGSAEAELKSRQISEAKSRKNLEMDTLYNEMTAKLQAFQAAESSYEAAEKNYGALQVKYQSGLLSRQEYLKGEVSYLQQKNSFKQAEQELSQAIAAYQWEIKGV